MSKKAILILILTIQKIQNQGFYTQNENSTEEENLKNTKNTQNPEISENGENEQNRETLIERIKEKWADLKYNIKKKYANSKLLKKNRNMSNSVNLKKRVKNESDSEVSYNSIKNIEFMESYILNSKENLEILNDEDFEDIFNLLKKFENEGFFENKNISRQEWAGLYDYFEDLSEKEKNEICKKIKKKKEKNKIQQEIKKENIFDLEKKLKKYIFEISELKIEKKTNLVKNIEIQNEIDKRQNFINEYLFMNDRIFSLLENNKKKNYEKNIKNQNELKIVNFNSPFSNVNFEPYNYDNNYYQN